MLHDSFGIMQCMRRSIAARRWAFIKINYTISIAVENVIIEKQIVGSIVGKLVQFIPFCPQLNLKLIVEYGIVKLGYQ